MNAIYRYNQSAYFGRLFKRFMVAILLGGWLCIPAHAQATKNYTNWYFGTGAGLTLNSGTPQTLTDGQLQTDEGCAAISDASGQLLFYTDGRTIWNRNHDIMPGATELGGSNTSTQSALIVPYQNSAARFYIFSVADETGQTGVQYAIVNMTMNGGLGGLETKNKLVVASATEKITVINHCNNLNHWIITHEKGNNTFRVNLLNDNGLIPAATSYRVGSVHAQNKGYMKPSHDGRKLAVAVSGGAGTAGFVEVFDFDNKTGAISNPVKLAGPETDGVYGIEFSPDNKLLYLSSLSTKKIQQISVDGLTINATLTTQSQRNASVGVGALQLGPDGKIYGSQPGEDYLITISQPNQAGAGCGLVSQGVYLGGKTSRYGLPFVLDEIPFLPPSLTISLSKLAGCNAFVLESHPVNLDPNYLAYEWYVGGVAVKDASGPTLRPVKSGTYSLKVRETKCRDVQEFSNEIPVVLVEANPALTAVPDSCGTFRLTAHATGGLIQWTGTGVGPDRASLDSIVVSGISGTQTYQVRVTSPTDATCFSQKDVTVSFTAPPPFQFTPAKRTACGDTLRLNAIPTPDWNTFRWQLPNGSNATGTALVARQSGLYRLTALSTATGCKSETAVTVTLNPNPVLQLTTRRIDTCFANSTGSSLELDAGMVPDGVFAWTKDRKTLGSDQQQTVREYGLFHVTVRTAAGCSASDSVRIVSSCPPLPPNLSMPDAFTPNGDGLNEKLVLYATGIEEVRLSIYNRWGEVVYAISGTPPDQSGWETWDGTCRGQPVASGSYTYRLEMKNATLSAPFVRRGIVQVVR